MSVGYLFFCARCSAFRYFCWLALPPCRAATQGNQQKTLRRVLVFCVFALSRAATQGKLPKTLRRVLWVRCSAGCRAATQGNQQKTLRRVLECTSMDCAKLSTI